VRSSGWRRLSSAVGAGLAWSATVWVTALGTLVARLLSLPEAPHEVCADGSQPSP
jgi:hypothetical protein